MNYFSTPLGATSEIIVDSFAGGGGASTGIEMALAAMKRSGIPLDSTDVNVAINHSGAALAMHMANHPNTIHLEADIWAVDPRATAKGRPIGLLWASPDCTHFSSAKGGQPVSAKIRGLAESLIPWATDSQPRMIFLENVKEFLDWGPLIPSTRKNRKKGDMMPDPKRKGETFKAWVKAFRGLGYRVEWKVLRACDYGAPTIRTRLFVIMRRDGEAIVWPEPTHGDPKSPGVRAGRRLPWRTAAEIIDWDRACPSIFMDSHDAADYRKATGQTVIRPLAPNTMKRIAAGVKRYVLDAEKPFIVTCNHAGDGFRGQGLDEPFKTVTSSRDAHGVVMPHIMTMRNSGKPFTAANEPVHTITAGGARLSVVSAFVTTYYGDRGDGVQDRGSSMEMPLSTIPTANRHGVVHAFMTVHNTGDPDGTPVDKPLRAITGVPKTDLVQLSALRPPLTPEEETSARQVAEFMRAHGYWDDREFVTVGDRIIVDIGMRMLVPRELARAQGFPEDYILAAPYAGAKGGVLGETLQRHKIGNSVCPPVAAALVEANYRPQTRVPYRSGQGWLFDQTAA